VDLCFVILQESYENLSIHYNLSKFKALKSVIDEAYSSVGSWDSAASVATRLQAEQSGPHPPSYSMENGKLFPQG